MSLYITTDAKPIPNYASYYRVCLRFYPPRLRKDGGWAAPGRELGTFTRKALESHGLPAPGEMGLLTVIEEAE